MEQSIRALFRQMAGTINQNHTDSDTNTSTLMQSPFIMFSSNFNMGRNTTTYIFWYSFYALLFFLFYVFSSPFTSNRELRRQWSGYVFFSTALYVWLSVAVAFHLPILHYDTKVPISLFSPLLLASIITLLIFEGVVKLLNRWFVYHIGFKQNSLEVLQNSILVSIICCVVYTQCGTSTSSILERTTLLGLTSSAEHQSSTIDATLNAACALFFSGHTNNHSKNLPTVFVLWSTAMSMLVINFAFERLAGFRGLFAEAPNVRFTKPHRIVPKPIAQSAQLADSLTRGRRKDAVESLPVPISANTAVSKISHAASGAKNARPAASASSGSSSSTSSVHVSPTSLFPSLLSRTSSELMLPWLPQSYFEALSTRMQEALLTPKMLDMVSWYEIAVSATAVDMLIGLKLFLGRFDMRTLQAALPMIAHSPAVQEVSSPVLSISDLVRSNAATKRELYQNPGSRPSSSQSNAHPLLNSFSSSLPATAYASMAASTLTSSSPALDAPFVYEHLSEAEDLWFDWMSDCGDGFNPSYQVTRMLAAPTLRVQVQQRNSKNMGILQLPRARVLFLGGDLAYPNPSTETYENRFFNCFQCALPPPLGFDPGQISSVKPAIAKGLAGLKEYSGPQAFVLPGNHDWFDGLQTYLRYICARDWLGGWLMPQTRSWFALRLSHRYWIFGLDNGLSNDIDVHQYQYFASIVQLHIADDEQARVILMYHEPDWVINNHEKLDMCANIHQLQLELDGKVVLKIAGDLHHYTRHMPAQVHEDADRSSSSPSPTAAAAEAAAVAASLPASGGSSVPAPANLNAYPYNLAPSFTQARAMPSEVDEWRWWNPLSWFYSLIKGRRSYNSRVYLEDLLADIDSGEIATELQMARTVSSPNVIERHQAKMHSSSSSSSLPSSATLPPFTGVVRDSSATDSEQQSSSSRFHAKTTTHAAHHASSTSSSSSSSSSAFFPSSNASASSSPSDGVPLKQHVRHHQQLSKEQHRLQAEAREPSSSSSASPSSTSTPFSPPQTASPPPHKRIHSAFSFVDSPPLSPHDSSSHNSPHNAQRDARRLHLVQTNSGNSVNRAPGSGSRNRRARANSAELMREKEGEERERERERSELLARRSPPLMSSSSSFFPQRNISPSIPISPALSPSPSSSSSSGSPFSPPFSSASCASSAFPARLPQFEASLLLSKPMRLWSQHEVGLWLDGVGCLALQAAFVRHEIDGKLLLELDDDDLAAELEIASRLRRKKLLAERKLWLELVEEHQSSEEAQQREQREREEDEEQPQTSDEREQKRNVNEADDAESDAASSSSSSSSPFLLPSPSALHSKVYDAELHHGTIEQRSRNEDEAKVEEEHKAFPSAVPSASSSSSSSSERKRTKLTASASTPEEETKEGTMSESKEGIISSSSLPLSAAELKSLVVEPLHSLISALPFLQQEEGGVGLPVIDQSKGYERVAYASSSGASPLQTASSSASASPASSRQPALVVSGGGGAFLHSTHCPSSAPIDVHGTTYLRTTSYPSLNTSRAYALLNIFGFRKRNFRFDVCGGVAYFLLVYSVLPLCHLDQIVAGSSWHECVRLFVRAIALIHIKMAEETWISFAVFLLLWCGLVQLAEESWPLYKRFLVGTLHLLAHSCSAFGGVVLLETFVEVGLQRGLLGNDESVLLTFAKAFPTLAVLLEVADSYTMGAFSGAIRLLSVAFDVPEAVAHLKSKMCAAYPSHTAALFLDPNSSYTQPHVNDIYEARLGIGRYEVFAYYVATGLFLWVLATSLVSFVFGSYLYLMNAFMNAHATPAFSSLRVEGYKNFLRFHLNRSGDLEMFVLGMDRCPRRWEIDPLWSGFTGGGAEDASPSHEWKVPSVLKPCKNEPDGVRLVDYLVIKRDAPTL